ncbi:cytochrome P450 [Thelephora ganbajun]|uniref:Cytochrome P450 n=1 Tax=Thelephora ganbajun TaxID=370292 RepID=A0ACB6ZMD7_THEGA|nr:cytochrome P450 [Thelephora ganbajun]
MDRSASASIPTSTSSPPYSIPLPSGSGSWLYTTLAVLFTLLALEQSVYRYKKRHLPGAAWTIPVIGKFADSLKPTMEGYMRQWNAGDLSAVSVFNIFIVMASSNEYSRKILNSPTYAEPCLVHAAKQIIFPDNWVFLTGKEHVAYRKALNLLFTRKALSLYFGIQDKVTREHFRNWVSTDGKPRPIMMIARHLNMDTSLRVFCGDHIPAAATQEISDKYWDITRALELVNFPLALPGTKIWRAIRARKVAFKWLVEAAAKSKVHMANGGEPTCMLDGWLQTIQDPEWKGRKEFSDREMAMVIFSFLFASQDAMSSGLIYAFQHLADNPAVLAKVREEQDRVRGDPNNPMTLELFNDMPYLNAVVKESFRVKPPVLMVPYKTTRAFPISDDYTVPANSMVIPSFYNSLQDPEVYSNPQEFDPTRWLDPNGPAQSSPRNYLVFGSGPHRCIGVEYAIMNIALVIAHAVSMWDWEHARTHESDEIEIIATIFPKDGCHMKFTPRAT